MTSTVTSSVTRTARREQRSQTVTPLHMSALPPGDGVTYYPVEGDTEDAEVAKQLALVGGTVPGAVFRRVENKRYVVAAPGGDETEIAVRLVGKNVRKYLFCFYCVFFMMVVSVVVLFLLCLVSCRLE